MPAGPPASIPSSGFAIPLSDSLVRQCIQMLLVGMKSHTHTHTHMQNTVWPPEPHSLTNSA